MRPVNHIKHYDFPFHLPTGYEKDVMDMLAAGIIQKCKGATAWHTKAFPVAKSDGTSCRLVVDWRGVHPILKKLLHQKERCNQLLRHVLAESKIFAVIDTASGYHQLRVHCH